MADEGDVLTDINPDPAAGANGADNLPSAGVISQYIKDLSVENPNAPQCFQWNEQPQLDVQVNIASEKVSDEVHEVTLKVTCAAKTSQGPRLFAVDGKAAGLTRTALSTMDQTRKQAKLEFNNTPAKLIGTEGKGWDVLSQVFDLAAVALAAEQVGGAQKVLEMAVQYAKDRIQFGRPIASFQAIRWMAADAYTELEASELLFLRAALLKDAGRPHAIEAAMAKLFASEIAERVCSDAIQIHGGYGYLADFPVERIYRDVRITQIYEGTSDIQRLVIARAISGIHIP